MSRQSLEQVLPAGDRLLLDSSTLIAHLNGGESTTPVATYVIDELVRSGRNTALVSAATAMEVLVRPLQAGPPGMQHAYDFLSHWPNLHVVPIDLPTALQAANVRAFQGFRPPDALVIGTGLMHQVGHLVTNDARWKTLPSTDVHVCCLMDHLPFP